MEIYLFRFFINIFYMKLYYKVFTLREGNSKEMRFIGFININLVRDSKD